MVLILYPSNIQKNLFFHRTKIDVDKFWGCANSDDIHEIPNPEGTASLRTRVIEFTGKFEPVKWTCRTPLQNGKLCPRRDRLKV